MGASLGSLSAASLVRSDAVHRDIYLDEGLFQAEMRNIFERTWVYVGHESEIPRPGDYRTTSIGTSPVIMCRDEAGVVRVLMNRCLHRAATVCQSERGNAGSFKCDYHGWTYDMAGALRGVTMPRRFGADFDKSRLGLKPAARVGSYKGFVFASLSKDGPGLETHLGNARYYLDLFVAASPRGAIEAKHGAHKYFYDANWKFQLENSVDGYHPYFVHRSFFDLLNQAAEKRYDAYDDGSSATSKDLGNGHSALDQRAALGDSYFERVKMAPGGAQLIERMTSEHGAAETRRILNSVGGNGFNLAVFPNLVIIGVQIRVIRPVKIDLTHVDVYPTSLVGVPDAVNDLRLRTHEAFFGPAGFGAPDDLEMFNRVQIGLNARSVEWLLLGRGLDAEVSDSGIITAHASDETPQRAQYKEWLRLMVAEAAPAGIAA